MAYSAILGGVAVLRSIAKAGRAWFARPSNIFIDIASMSYTVWRIGHEIFN